MENVEFCKYELLDEDGTLYVCERPFGHSGAHAAGIIYDSRTNGRMYGCLYWSRDELDPELWPKND